MPVQEPSAQGRRMYIPRGQWYNYWSDDRLEGGVEKWVAADLDTMPLYVKAGAIIPKYPVQQYVGEKKLEELILDAYFTIGSESSEVYEDAQDGYDYKKGRYSLRNFKLTGKEGSLSIQQFKDGSFITEYDQLKLRLHGLPFEIAEIRVDNEDMPLSALQIERIPTLMIDKNFTSLHIVGK